MVLVLQARVVEAKVEDRLKERDLSIRRLGLLGHLQASPGISFSELARRAGIKVQSLQPVVQDMLRLGYVRTIGDVGQGRPAMLALTIEGSDALHQAAESLTDLDTELFADGDWKELSEILIRIAIAFQRNT